jgi:hypothetical protein
LDIRQNGSSHWKKQPEFFQCLDNQVIDAAGRECAVKGLTVAGELGRVCALFEFQWRLNNETHMASFEN